MRLTLSSLVVPLAVLLAVLLAVSLSSVSAHADHHGLSLNNQLKYGAGFDRFDYTSMEARVGGTLTLHAMGSFDKMNPYTLKGSAPDLMETLLFETLALHALDEPFAQYGLLAQKIQPDLNGRSVTYTLHPAARFSDGRPVTAEDVRFSFEMLKSDQAHPFYRSYWRDIVRAEALDRHTVRLHFRQTDGQKNRELAMIASDLPVFSRFFFEQRDFDQGDLTPLIASGPYRVESWTPGKTITYRRNPDYWGWEVPTRRGFFNFERIVIKYFKDPVVALEAFKAGSFDFIHVNNSKQWARDYQGGKFDAGTLVKESLPHKNGAGMQGFVFNLRRTLFQERDVRKAIELAFDFEWSNRNLFYGQYRRTNSFFANSEMAARNAPSSEELHLLEPWRNHLSPEVFQPLQPPPTTQPPGSLRHNLRKAVHLLRKAGWRVGDDGVLTHQDGRRFEMEILLVSPAFERVMAPFAANLKRLGIIMHYRTVDAALYQRRVETFDYDMIVAVFPQSQSPGNEQHTMWHSESADRVGSRNLIGLKDPAIDALVQKIIYTKNRKDLITACRALDRVLLAGHYLIPNWHIPYHRVAYRNRFARPDKKPLYYNPISWLMTWWIQD